MYEIYYIDPEDGITSAGTAQAFKEAVDKAMVVSIEHGTVELWNVEEKKPIAWYCMGRPM